MITPKVAGVLIGVAAIFAAGWQTSEWRRDSIEHHAAQLAEQHRAETQAALDTVAQRTAEAISAIRIEYRTIHNTAVKEVIRDPIYVDCVVPADGSRLLNEARGGNTESGSGRDAAMSTNATGTD